MTEQELKQWFWNKFFSCYSVKHDDYPDAIFMVYDKQFLRKVVINFILGKDIEYPKDVKGICLFEIDYDNNFLWTNYDEIWSVLEKHLLTEYHHIQSIVKGWLSESDKLDVLTPGFNFPYNINRLFDADKPNILMPSFLCSWNFCNLSETDKLNILTPMKETVSGHTILSESDKLKLLKIN
jgi:hypothetical protein